MWWMITNTNMKPINELSTNSIILIPGIRGETLLDVIVKSEVTNIMGGTVLDFKNRDALRAARVREERIFEKGYIEGFKQGFKEGFMQGFEEGLAERCEKGRSNYYRGVAFRMLAHNFKAKKIRWILGLSRDVMDKYEYEYNNNKQAIHKQYNIDSDD